MPNRAPDTFAERLMRLRAERRLSREALARLMGVTKVTIWHWERGGSTPRSNNLLALAGALDVSPHYLEFGLPEDTPAGQQPRLARPILRQPPQLHPHGSNPRGQVLSDVMDEAKRIIANATGVDPSRITVQIDY